MDKLSLFVPLAKVDEDQRLVWGYASTEKIDCQGEVVEKAGMVEALDDYMKWANIREMHKPSAVGTTKEAEIDDKGLYICAKIVDPTAWQKVKEGVYKGFSIGGSATQKVGKVIKKMILNEISLVDRPANPECLIEVWKSADFGKAGNNEPGHEFHGNQYTDPDGKSERDKGKKGKKGLTKEAVASKIKSRRKIIEAYEDEVEDAIREEDDDVAAIISDEAHSVLSQEANRMHALGILARKNGWSELYNDIDSLYERARDASIKAWNMFNKADIGGDVHKAGNNESGHPFRGNQYTDPDGKSNKEKKSKKSWTKETLTSRIGTTKKKISSFESKIEAAQKAGDAMELSGISHDLWQQAGQIRIYDQVSRKQGWSEFHQEINELGQKAMDLSRKAGSLADKAPNNRSVEIGRWRSPDAMFDDDENFLGFRKSDDDEDIKKEAIKPEESTQQEEDDMTPQQEEKLEKIAKSAESIDKLVSASENLMKANQELSKSNQDLVEQIKKQSDQIKEQEERIAKMEKQPVEPKATLRVVEKGGQGPVAKQENGVTTVEFDPSNPASVEKASTVIFKSILADGGTPVVKMRSEEIPLALRK